MDIRVLRYFLAAAEEQSITGAAQKLHVTQPTLSRQFMELEEELGHALFIRTNRKLRLTPKGELFYERARSIVTLFERTKAEIRAEDELAGEIRIAAGETPALASLARAIARLQKEAPKVKFHITSGAEAEVKSELHSGLTDFGVFVGTADTVGYSAIKLKQKDVWGVLTPKNGPFAGKDRIEAADLIGEPLLCSEQSHRRNEFDGWLNDLKNDLDIVGTFNLLYNAYVLASAGVGHVIALGGVVNPAPESGLVWLPLYPKFECDILVAWDRTRHLSPAAERLIALLKEEEESEAVR